MRKTRGMTLIELIIYMALAVVACVLLWSIQNITRSTQNASMANYLVNGDTETCLTVLRRDLNESALAAVNVYPSSTAPSEPPGLSLVSSRAFGGEREGETLVNSWGAPQWDKHVFYTLQASDENTGSLIRWEKEIAQKNMLPVPATVLPSLDGREHEKVVLRDVLLPDRTVSGVGEGGSITTDKFGGFRAQFVRRVGGSGGEEQLTEVNPKNGNPHDNTRLMELELKLLQNEKSYYSIEFRVACEH